MTASHKDTIMNSLPVHQSLDTKVLLALFVYNFNVTFKY